MTKPNILCVDDQREVLAALKKDLAVLNSLFNIIDCESAAEADEVINELDADGEMTPLIICDHIMPGENGVDFLARINEDDRFKNVKRLLLTGLATHQDTIHAINYAHIDLYIEKPWAKDELLSFVKILLTKYLINSGVDYSDYMSFMDQPTLYKELKNRV